GNVMVLNRSSPSIKALDGGVGGDEVLMAALRCPRVADRNVL
ncbi:unnamed protein product, partial [Penicillium nalgiovense]